MNADETKKQILEMEKGFLDAYRKRDAAAFTENFAEDYIGIANDGMKTTAGEVEKMNTFDLDELHLEDEEISFPAENTAIVTYKMVSHGRFQGKEVTGKIYTSTVWIKRDGQWSAVLHTESTAE